MLVSKVVQIYLAIPFLLNLAQLQNRNETEMLFLEPPNWCTIRSRDKSYCY